MQKTVALSTDVFAAIWACRKAGEDTEDEILRRVLGVAGAASPATPASSGLAVGVVDHRNGVTFPEGFEILRGYKGRTYTAVATHGSWLRKDSGQTYPTLNQLNASIAAGAENVWNGNWKYRDEQGKVQSIGKLRTRRQ